MELEGKTSIVTGGNSGIGRAVALLFAKEGAKVAVADIGHGTTVDDIIGERGSGIFVQSDIRISNQVENLVRTTMDKFGSIDILCNVAGIELLCPLTEIEEKDWDRVIDTNLKGTYLTSKYVLPYMIQKREGVIVNVASQLGLVGGVGFSAYCASKAGVILLTRVMALECAKYGIRVNCICPGAIETPMVDREVNLEKDPEAARRDMISRHPIGRLGRPEEIAEAILFLASKRSSFMLGSSLVVDGGYTIV
jgi:NAD(P)-dependent dehydrogenase (short-subunit alcohol dehydrogenase family)